MNRPPMRRWLSTVFFGVCIAVFIQACVKTWDAPLAVGPGSNSTDSLATAYTRAKTLMDATPPDYAAALAIFTADSAAFAADSFAEGAAYRRPRCLYGLSRWSEAEPQFLAFEGSYPASSYADNAAGLRTACLQKLSRYSDAVNATTAFLSTYPNSTEINTVRMVRGISWFALADSTADTAVRTTIYTNAITDFTAVPDSSLSTEARERCGESYYELKLDNEAITALAPLYGNTASGWCDNARYITGRCRYRQSDFLNAALSFDATIAQDSSGSYSDNALDYAIRSYLKLGDTTAALSRLATLRRLFPADTALYAQDSARITTSLLSTTYTAAKSFMDDSTPPRYTEALAILQNNQTAFSSDTSFAEGAAYRRPRCQFGLSQWADALAGFSQFLGGFSASIYADNAAWYITECYDKLAQFTNAINSASNFLTAYPTSSYKNDALMLRGLCRYALTDSTTDTVVQSSYYTAAANDFSAVPDSALSTESRERYGESTYKLHQYTTAISILAPLYSNAGSSWCDNARYFTGLSYYHLADYTSAAQSFDAVVAQAPAGSYTDNALDYAIRSYLALGDKTTATARLATLRSLFPADTALYAQDSARIAAIAD